MSSYEELVSELWRDAEVLHNVAYLGRDRAGGALHSGGFSTLIERETDHVELKAGPATGPLQEAIVALSNGEGGVIFIGVTDQREVKGRLSSPHLVAVSR
jgi:Putative DNA-binding domain